jgi:hypothetical protein
MLTLEFDSESTLGIHTAYANEYHPYEMIPISRISSPLALISAYSNVVKKALWISVSFDHVQILIPCYSYRTRNLSTISQSGTEPEDFFDDDLGDE